jgi:hypothetical protein
MAAVSYLAPQVAAQQEVDRALGQKPTASKAREPVAIRIRQHHMTMLALPHHVHHSPRPLA